MSYLMGYAESREKTDAPNFRRKIFRSFLWKVFLLCLLVPFDILYITANRKKLNQKFDIIIFSEKYKKICKSLNCKTALVTSPSLTMYFNKNKNVQYIPASIFFLFALLSIIFDKLLYLKIHSLRGQLLILHTDGLPVPRFLLKVINYDKSICIQHGEFKYLNDIYDGMLCDQNILLGEDQAKLFRDKGYRGKIFNPASYSTNKSTHKNHKFNAIVLVGQGLHINDRRLHQDYQKKLQLVSKKLSQKGFQIRYRPHPSEYPWHYTPFITKLENSGGKDKINLLNLYLGEESTLLRLVKELGGISLRLEEVDDQKIEELLVNYLKFKESKNIVTVDQPFLQFIVEKLNANF